MKFSNRAGARRGRERRGSRVGSGAIVGASRPKRSPGGRPGGAYPKRSRRAWAAGPGTTGGPWSRGGCTKTKANASEKRSSGRAPAGGAKGNPWRKAQSYKYSGALVPTCLVEASKRPRRGSSGDWRRLARALRGRSGGGSTAAPPESQRTCPYGPPYHPDRQNGCQNPGEREHGPKRGYGGP